MLKTYSLLLLFTFLKINPAKAVNLSIRIGFKQQPERGYFTVMKLIPLSKTGTKYKGKYFAQVDDDMYDYLNQFNWSAMPSRNTFYAIAIINKKAIKMCHVVLPPKTGTYTIDHIDKNGLNNQSVNLREATRSQNSCNRTAKKNAHSKYIGVHKSKNIWACSIRKNGKDYHIGRYKTELEAAMAYDKAAKIFHGEFASQNFSEPSTQETEIININQLKLEL